MENTLAARLMWARRRAGLTQEELAEGLRAKGIKISQSTIASWESGGHMTGRKIPAVAVYLGVSPLWLSDGDGQSPLDYEQKQPPVTPPIIAKRHQDSLQALVVLGNITEREAAILAKFRLLDEQYRLVIEAAIDAMPSKYHLVTERRR